MGKTEKNVDVDAPVRPVYNQWTQFEEFPSFMEGVKRVQQLDDKRLHWKAEIAGKEVEWDAEIVEQIPDQRISWRSTSGARNDGTVTFTPVNGDLTRVALVVEYEPSGPAELAGTVLGAVDRRVDGDLKRFKEFIERRGRETGGWRGEIRSGKVRKEEELEQEAGR